MTGEILDEGTRDGEVGTAPGRREHGPPLPAEEVDPIERSTWYRGLDLQERLESLRRAAGAQPKHDPELAARRLRHWRDRPPLSDDAVWSRRLELADATPDELWTLSGESPEALRDRSHGVPPWLEAIARAYSAPVAEPLAWPDGEEVVERSPFLPLVEPLVRASLDRLIGRVRRLVEGLSAEPPFDADAAPRVLLSHLPELLALPLARVLVVELHVAREEERLPGDSPRERFEAFRSSLYRRSIALDVLSRYPVLARLLVLRLEQWEQSAFDLLRDLATDAPELRRRFAEGRALGRLVESRGGLSDPHHGGRMVFVLRFDSGVKVVYKPRPLAAERAFQELLSWVNEAGCRPPFATLQVVDRGDHGWMEHVESAPCGTEEELWRFFTRQGGYLALLHLLEGTDLHHENLIAAGEHPVLVDLETLFHPPVDGPTLRDPDSHPGASLRDSVLASGLLPQRIWAGKERSGVDLSGLGARTGQMTPTPMLAPTDRNTDAMRFERRPLEIPLAENRPRLGNRDGSVLDFGAALEEGYTQVFRLLVRHREELCSEDGPLAVFTGAEVRVIFRPTAAYGSLLTECSHPHVAGNALERQRLFDRLWTGVEARPFLEGLIASEQEELARGDVPRFATRPDSTDVWSGSGASFPAMLEEAGLDRVRRRLARWSEGDLVRQRSVIRGSLDALRLETGAPPRVSYPFRPGERPAPESRLLEASRAVGGRLLDQALRAPGEAFWLTVDYVEPGGWRLAPTRPDFYLGQPGIALFLGYLGVLTDDADATETARLALRGQALQIERDADCVTGIGVLNGWGGVIYALAHLGALWRDEEVLDQAEGCLSRLPALVDADTTFDLGAGAAGCLLGVLALARERPSDLLWDVARRCGDRLLAAAEPQERGGIGWSIPLAGNRVLAGISHGGAGIALALFRLAAATGQERFQDAALRAVEFERTLFSPEHRNWPDLRAWPAETDAKGASASASGPDPEASERFMCAWCHGAPGIGIARLAGLDHFDDSAVREEIAVAVRTTLAEGFGENHSLCHGDLGNLDFLLEASHLLDDQDLHSEVYRRAATVLESIERDGYLFGLPGNVETPGLMVGLAGIGYGLARLAAPARLPSLLAMDPPPPTAGLGKLPRQGTPLGTHPSSQPRRADGWRLGSGDPDPAEFEKEDA